MNDTMIDPGQPKSDPNQPKKETQEEILTYTVSDETLEAAAGSRENITMSLLRPIVWPYCR
jgi:hypothetical protein